MAIISLPSFCFRRFCFCFRWLAFRMRECFSSRQSAIESVSQLASGSNNELVFNVCHCNYLNANSFSTLLSSPLNFCKLRGEFYVTTWVAQFVNIFLLNFSQLMLIKLLSDIVTLRRLDRLLLVEDFRS